MYEGEIVQHVVPQQLGARLVYRYTNVDRSYGYLLIVAVHHDSYLRADKYLYKVVNLAFSLALVFLLVTLY